MSYLLQGYQNQFFGLARYLIASDMQQNPIVVCVTLQDLLKRYKAQYEKVPAHLSFDQFFQNELNIQDRAIAKRVFQDFLSRVIPPYRGQMKNPDFAVFFQNHTPFLLKQALHDIVLVSALSQYSLKQIVPVIETQAQLAKLLQVLQHVVLKSPDVNNLLIEMFLDYRLPQSMIDYEVTRFRAFMDDLFCDFSKRNTILKSIREWQSYTNEQKVSVLQEFVVWHSSAFGITVPRIVVENFDPAYCGFVGKDHLIIVSVVDIRDKPPVELLLFCLHENTYNYHTHLHRDFELESKRDLSRVTGFYQELSHDKDVRKYVKNLYLSACNYQGTEEGLDFYYLQPFKFHAFTHEFLFATLFLEEFTKVDSSRALYKYQNVGSLVYRQVESSLAQVHYLVGMYMRGVTYGSLSLKDVHNKFMPRYITFLEVYCGRDSEDKSLLKARNELARYGSAYQESLWQEGVDRALAPNTSYDDSLARGIEKVLAE